MPAFPIDLSLYIYIDWLQISTNVNCILTSVRAADASTLMALSAVNVRLALLSITVELSAKVDWLVSDFTRCVLQIFSCTLYSQLQSDEVMSTLFVHRCCRGRRHAGAPLSAVGWAMAIALFRYVDFVSNAQLAQQNLIMPRTLATVRN